MDLDYLWSNLPVFFEKHGFVITDLNETKKIYYVDFVRPDMSMWDKIWGDDAPIVDIVDAKYQFVLTKIDNQTALTIYNANGNVLPIETLNRVFDVMEPGLSFRNVY
jgi:outer membrane protein assembly factor BamC